MKFDNEEIVIQGDYMIPLLDIFKGTDARSMLAHVYDEYKNNQETKFLVNRSYVKL